MALQWEDSAVTKILFLVLEVMPYLSEFPLCVSGLGSCYMYGSYRLGVGTTNISSMGLLLHKLLSVDANMLSLYSYYGVPRGVGLGYSSVTVALNIEICDIGHRLSLQCRLQRE